MENETTDAETKKPDFSIPAVFGNLIEDNGEWHGEFYCGRWTNTGYHRTREKAAADLKKQIAKFIEKKLSEI